MGNPLEATDAALKDYADYYLEYDAAGRVTEAVVGGAGCSCAGGFGAYAYAYAANPTAAGAVDPYNTWSVRTVETLPDGNRNTVYANVYGQVMLAAFRDVASGLEWESYARFDGGGRAVLLAGPEAVTGYDDSYNDLVNHSGGGASYLADDQGLVVAQRFGLGDAATETTPGEVQVVSPHCCQVA